jgi:hypothetical protein
MSERDYAGWLIKKGQYYYRPNWCGYTVSRLDAGRYTRRQAEQQRDVEPHNFTIEAAPETESGGIGIALNELLRRGG